jgi:DHA1 family bicyclomycin/chloramphenicol resistance-like MFS transporter
MLISLGGFALAAIGCASAHSLAMLLVFRLMQGCAAGMATTLPLAIVGDMLAGTSARQMMSEISTLSSFMPVIAPAIGNLTIRMGGWRFLFGAQALYGCAIAFAALQFPETLRKPVRQPLQLQSMMRNWGMLLSEPRLLTFAFVYGLLFSCTFCFTAVSPLILIQRMGMTSSTYAAVFAINSVGSMLGAAVSALLSKRGVPVRRIILSGILLVTASTLAASVLQLHQPAVTRGLIPAAFLALFGFNLAGPSLLLEALGGVPRLLGSGSGLMRCVFMFMNFASSAALAVFCARHAQYVEVATALSMAGLSICALLLFVWLTQRNHGRSGTMTVHGVCP